MTRAELETLFAEVGRVAGTTSLAMIGSQCVHAATTNPPAEVLMSRECDVLIPSEDPLHESLLAALGKNSSFYDEHGTYLDAVSPSFPFLPDGWEQRASPFEIGGVIVRCLELHDLALSKLYASRLKDSEMIASLVHVGLITLDGVRDRILAIADPRLRAVMLAKLQIFVEGTR